jgi:hypothetical protein
MAMARYSPRSMRITGKRRAIFCFLEVRTLLLVLGLCLRAGRAALARHGSRPVDGHFLVAADVESRKGYRRQ